MKKFEWFFSFIWATGSGHCFLTFDTNKVSRDLIAEAKGKIRDKYYDAIGDDEIAIMFFHCIKY